jgi:glycosyltransferase involved in cell wall biosynthesis
MYLSVIIPTLNEERYLPRLLESLGRQTFQDFETIVSDGNSQDKTREIASGFGVRLTTSAERSPACQRNAGARVATGDVLLFFDADTFLLPDFLEKIVGEFKQRQLGGGCFYLEFESDHLRHKLVEISYNFFCFLRQYLSPISVGTGIILKREFHERLHGFDETIFVAEDYDYCHRLAKVAYFRVLKSRRLFYSVRRLDKEGNLRTLLKWLYMGLFTLFNIPIRKKITKYDYGNY